MFYLWVNFFGISDYTQVDVNAINKLRHYAFHLRKAQLAEVHHMLEKINKEKTIQAPYLSTFQRRIFLFIYIYIILAGVEYLHLMKTRYVSCK